MIMLTFNNTRASIDIPLPHDAVGICTPFCPGQKRPVLSLVFLCPSKIFNKGLLLVRPFMVGCVRQLSSWSFLDDSANLIQLASNDFALKRGGLKSNPGETAMRNHTKKLTNNVSYKSQSRFNVLTRSGRSIARKVSFKTAINLKSGHPELTIKFDSMGAQ